MQTELKDLAIDPDYERYAYLTYEDLKGLIEQEGKEEDTLIAIRAPPGSTVEIPLARNCGTDLG